VLAYDRPPTGTATGVRIDDAIEAGSVVDTSYDSLLGKVIASGPDRATALARLRGALAGTTILGVTTSVGYLRALLDRAEVAAGELDTGLVERLGALAGPMDEEAVAVTAGMLLVADAAADAGDDPFARRDGWRLGGARGSSYWRLAVGYGGEPHDVEVPAEWVAMARRIAPGRFAVDGRGEWLLAADGDTWWIGHGGYAWPVHAVSPAATAGAAADGQLRAPMPGQVLQVAAAVGDALNAGDPVVVLESMKMELTLAAPADGTLAELTVAVGDVVTLDQPLARVEASAT
jgi:acetyl-CoA/propionyl-CoA carboxylase biotin carboxyl carrier protein